MTKLSYIDAPELMTREQRTMGTIVTAVMWAAYVYLWLPLVSLAAWGLGVEFAYDIMVRAGGAEALRTALFWYLVLLMDVTLTVAIWSTVNKLRFAGHNRRTAHERIQDTAMASYFGVTPEVLERLRTARRLEIDVDGAGRPCFPGSESRRPPQETEHRAA